MYVGCWPYLLCSSDLFFFCRYLQPNHTHGTNDIAATAEEAWSLIHVASHAARGDITEGSNRRKRVAQNQDVDARSSRIVVPSQTVIGFHISTTTNAQVDHGRPFETTFFPSPTSRPASNCEFSPIFDFPVINTVLSAVGCVNLI
jgi:hypothetical protein